MTMSYRIYGMAGHRMRASFGASSNHDFRTGPYARPVQMHVAREDESGASDYIDVTITAPDEKTILRELWAQIDDGLFEDCQYGSVIDLSTGASAEYPA